MPRELPRGGRLAGAVHAHDHDHRRPRADVYARLPHARGIGQQRDQALAERLAATRLARAGGSLERGHHRRGRGGADVGHYQRLLEAFPGLLVEVAEQRRVDLAAERLARGGHALAQPPHPSARRRLPARGIAIAVLPPLFIALCDRRPLRARAHAPPVGRPRHDERLAPVARDLRPPRPPRPARQHRRDGSSTSQTTLLW